MKARLVGQEYEAFTGWRKCLFWQKGELKKVKRGFNKRQRKEAKSDLKKDLIDRN